MHAKPGVGEVLHDGEMMLMRKFDGAFQEFARRLRARRIVRIVEHQHLHALPGIRGNRVQIRQEAAFRQ